MENQLSDNRKRTFTRWEPAILTVACLLPTAVTLVYFVAAAGSASSVQQAVYGCAKAVQFALPVVWIGLVCGERLGWPKWNLSGLWLGLGFGVAVAVATALMYQLFSGSELLEQALQPIREKIEGLNLNTTTSFVFLGIFYSLVHSLLEEYYWRWFVFGRMRHYMPLSLAIGLSSVAFALHHVVVLWAYFSHAPAMAVVLASSVAIGGAVWAWIYHRGSSIYAVWWSHAVVDAAIFGVGYVIAMPILKG